MEEQEYTCKFCTKIIKKSEKAPGWETTKFKENFEKGDK